MHTFVAKTSGNIRKCTFCVFSWNLWRSWCFQWFPKFWMFLQLFSVLFSAFRSSSVVCHFFRSFSVLFFLRSYFWSRKLFFQWFYFFPKLLLPARQRKMVAWVGIHTFWKFRSFSVLFLKFIFCKNFPLFSSKMKSWQLNYFPNLFQFFSVLFCDSPMFSEVITGIYLLVRMFLDVFSHFMGTYLVVRMFWLKMA